LEKEELRCSRYAFPYSKESYRALYHSLRIEKIYGTEEMVDLFHKFRGGRRVEEVLEEYGKEKREVARRNIGLLREKGFLVPLSQNEEGLLKEIRGQISPSPRLKTLFLLVTDRCNFSCGYCIVTKNLSEGNFRGDMNPETARNAIDYFLAHVRPEDKKEVIFYGGEPLLNFDLIRFCVAYVKEREEAMGRSLKNYRRSRFMINSNGSLITPEIAEFIAEEDIFVPISLDGPREVHNEMRKTCGGRGTYEDALRGYRLLKEAGGRVGISLTLGRHNIDRLEEIIEEFSRTFRPMSLGICLLHGLAGRENPAFIPEGVVGPKLIRAFEVARAHGVYLVKYVMDNRVKPFVEGSPRVKGCTGCGSKLVVFPDGRSAPCVGFGGIEGRHTHNINDRPAVEQIIPEEMCRRSTFSIEGCVECPAIAVCGGGCMYNAYLFNGSVWIPERDACDQSTRFLEWLIWDLFQKIEEGKRDLLREGSIIAPTPEENRLVYGEIDVAKPKLVYHI
jgi:radical SAM protein with 4Fe4S-binding SPASM domain